MTLHDLFGARAQEQPDAEAVIYGDTRLTYRDLARRVDQFVDRLHSHGVQRGDRVLTFAGNVPDVIAIYLAVSRVGGVYVPVSTGFREREITFVLANARPKLAIVAADHAAEFLRWVDPTALDVVVLGAGSAPQHLSRFDAPPVARTVVLHDAAEDAEAADDEDGLLLCYTSGTTSHPKPVLHSQRSEVYNATTYAEVWGLGPGDRGIVCLPLAWVYGLSTTTAAMLVSGATVVLLDRFHPVSVLDAIEEHRATLMWGTMSTYTKMLEAMKTRASVDLSSLRALCNGGEPCPAPLVAEFENRTGLKLLGAYATSEARPILAVRPDDTAAPESTVGRLVPGAQIRLEGPDGSPVATGDAGHALLRCPGLMTEYYREPGLTAERVTPDGWLRSGDILRVDADGYFFVVGRESDIIIRSGVNIAPSEVEAALLAHPSVAEAAVVGVADARSGEAVRAVLVVRPDDRGSLSEVELRRTLADQLAAFKIPEEFIFVDELPRTDRGKVDRLALRNLERTL
jgi:long-chain acyl-CoA synthetase